MCLGAPLARLLLNVEMRVIAERLPNLCFARAYEEREYLPVHEVQALVVTPFARDVTEVGLAKTGIWPLSSAIPDHVGWLHTRVAALRIV